MAVKINELIPTHFWTHTSFIRTELCTREAKNNNYRLSIEKAEKIDCRPKEFEISVIQTQTLPPFHGINIGTCFAPAPTSATVSSSLAFTFYWIYTKFQTQESFSTFLNFSIQLRHTFASVNAKRYNLI